MLAIQRGIGSQGSNVGVSVGGAVASASALAGPAAPIVAAVGGLIALGSTIAGALHIGEGCGPTCIQATQIVNSAEPTFRMNLEGYEQGIIDQSDAVNNFHQMWVGAIQQSCGAIPGVAGSNCIGDRESGSCKWKQTGNPVYPGQPQMGECWNWWNAYYDPLTKPSLVPYQGSGLGLPNSIDELVSNPLWIGIGLLAIGLMVSK